MTITANFFANILACVSGSMLEIEPATEVNKSGFMHMQKSTFY
jgi:hypothetical protein